MSYIDGNDEKLERIRQQLRQAPLVALREQLPDRQILEACRACGHCARACPAGCISGEIGQPPFAIDSNLCTRCGACFEVCPFEAITRS